MRLLVVLAGVVITLVTAVLIGFQDPVSPIANVSTPIEVPVVTGEVPFEAALPARSDEHTVEELLRTLEDEARRTGVLSQEVIGRGYAAVRQLRPLLGPDRTRTRALQLARSFRQIRRELEVAPVQRQLAALRTDLVAAKDRGAREHLVAEYAVVAGALPEPYRIEAMGKLDQSRSGDF